MEFIDYGFFGAIILLILVAVIVGLIIRSNTSKAEANFAEQD